MLTCRYGCVQRFQFSPTNADTKLLFQIYLSILNYYMELTDIEQDLEEKNVVWEVIWWPRDTLEPL